MRNDKVGEEREMTGGSHVLVSGLWDLENEKQLKILKVPILHSNLVKKLVCWSCS
jgi:hypothetical protein